jgi:hypothetical protein
MTFPRNTDPRNHTYIYGCLGMHAALTYHYVVVGGNEAPRSELAMSLETKGPGASDLKLFGTG